MIEIGISAELKAKCAKAALGCVEAVVATGATPPGLDEALRSCEEKIAKLPEPRAVLESSSILATRAIQSFGQRSRAISRFGGGSASSFNRRQRHAAHPQCGGRDQSGFGGEPAANRTL